MEIIMVLPYSKRDEINGLKRYILLTPSIVFWIICPLTVSLKKSRKRTKTEEICPARHHDSDIHDPLPTDGFSAFNVATLTSQSIDIRPVPSGLLFHAGLATTWEFSGFLLLSHAEYLTISLSAMVYHWERKARAAAKKQAERKRAADGEGGSKGKTKRRKVFTVRAEEGPLRAMTPNPSLLLKNVDDVEIAESREDEHVTTRPKAKKNALLWFEALYDAHLALKERCEDVTRQLVSTRTDFTHVSNLYNTLSSRYQQVRGEHAGCAEKLADAERERDELRAVNDDQVSHIKELEAELARKDSALVFSDRISNERAAENERLVSQLGFLEKEKIDSIGKLLPTVVRRLLSSHEYKESLSVPFNLAIQAGWAKGLAMKRSEEDLMEVLREVQGFDPHSDTRMTLLKMYPIPPPEDAPIRVNLSSKVASVSRAVPSKVIPTATTTASKVIPHYTHSTMNPDPTLLLKFLNLRPKGADV
ncbi:hypothetical protein Tco_1211508 [Tanacetum coccineum]